MDAVTISTRYQIIIPREVCKELRLKPGQKMRVIQYDNRVVLIPLRPIEEGYGSLKGIETDIPRDEKDSE
jgi:AbrB family looped-hinge helix DNA binding protein